MRDAAGTGRRARRTAACLAVLVVTASAARATIGGAPAETAAAIERIRDAPLRGDGFAALAQALFRDGDLARATAAAQEAVRLEPDAPAYHRLVGYLLAAGGGDLAAEAAFRRAAELDPAARVSLADFHLARAWAEYQDALRRGSPAPGLEERLRALAAVTEVSPEVKALIRATDAAVDPGVTERVAPIMLGPEVAHALVVEKRTQTLRLYARTGDSVGVQQTYPCSTGQTPGTKTRRGDRRTPNGVYVVTDLLPGDRLPELYGALALPLSYPNAWDRTFQRNGGGIWLHASDRLASPLSPRDSQGCIILRNDDLIDLTRRITPGVTPVLITEEIASQPAAEWQATVRAVLNDVSTEAVLAMIGAPEYTVVMRRAGDAVVHDYLQHTTQWVPVATERAVPLEHDVWRDKLNAILPSASAQLVGIQILDDPAAPRVVIEMSAPATARTIRPERSDRIYLDLPGVRSAPLPSVVTGAGPWVSAVRVAPADYDPPATRLVIDLRQAMTYRLASAGRQIVIALSPN